jgi:hypothetical protein
MPSCYRIYPGLDAFTFNSNPKQVVYLPHLDIIADDADGARFAAKLILPDLDEPGSENSVYAIEFQYRLHNIL